MTCCVTCAYLLDLESLLIALAAGACLASLCLGRGRIGHVDVGHAGDLCRGGGVCGESDRADDECGWRVVAVESCAICRCPGCAAQGNL